MTTQLQLWLGAAGAAVVAVLSGLGEYRRRRRKRIDDVGFVPWVSIQVMAMIATAILAGLALHLFKE